METYSPKQIVSQINYLKNNSPSSFYQGRKRQNYLIPGKKEYDDLIQLRKKLYISL